ncbi:MAG: hypothetical protein ACI9FB_004533 [Candidatus Azotimanducaceae bacterium]|jgi:hypothetical protein
MTVMSFPVLAADPGQKFGPWIRGLSGGLIEQLDADLSDTASKMRVSRRYTQASVGYAWDKRTIAALSISFGYTDYGFSSLATIGGLQPWGKIENYQISLPTRFAIGETTNAFLIPSIETSKESGASTSDGRTAGLIGGISWKISETLTLGPGLGWFSEIGGDHTSFPILVIDWEITDNLNLSTGRGLASLQGPGLKLDYKLAKKWNLGLSASYEKTRFSLDDTIRGSGSIGEDQSLPLVFSIAYSPWSTTNITLLLGAKFNGRLQIEDSNNRRLAQTDLETATIVGLSFSSRF